VTSSGPHHLPTPPSGAGQPELAAALLEPAELAARLRLSATRLARRLRQESDTGLTPSQLSALATIDRNGAMTLGRLAEDERVAPPTITKIVSKLEADGLVQRRADDHDRRVTHVGTTGAGAALLHETRRQRDAWLTARIHDLDASDRARLAAALDVLDLLTTRERP
jgi:DNA-binding MarR family transcriptional regulator